MSDLMGTRCYTIMCQKVYMLTQKLAREIPVYGMTFDDLTFIFLVINKT
jgi:hypothetical protein